MLLTCKKDGILYYKNCVSTHDLRVLIKYKFHISRRLFHLLRPLGDRIIIELVEVEEKTAFGIVLPDSAKEKPQEGNVIAVGTGFLTDSGTTVPLNVKEGDRVIYSQYAGTEVKYEGKEYLILRESDILAIIG